MSGWIPLGSTREYVNEATNAIMHLFTGWRKKNVDLYYAVLYFNCKDIPFLSDVFPLVQEQMIYRMSNHVCLLKLRIISHWLLKCITHNFIKLNNQLNIYGYSNLPDWDDPKYVSSLAISTYHFYFSFRNKGIHTLHKFFYPLCYCFIFEAAIISNEIIFQIPAKLNVQYIFDSSMFSVKWYFIKWFEIRCACFNFKFKTIWNEYVTRHFGEILNPPWF